MDVSKNLVTGVGAALAGLYLFAKWPKIARNRAPSRHRWLVFGGIKGWIGQQLVEMLRERGEIVYVAQTRLEMRESVAAELDAVKPTRILNAAGVTGRPNVDWCESNKEATMRANVIGTLNLIDLAAQRGIHVTNFATGCIYEYDQDHKMYSGVGFKEEDLPNFTSSWYSYTKGLVEQFYCCYDNLLTLRLRMPISDDLNSRSFVTKIAKYERVVNIPNSMSVLHDLLPVALDMSQRKLTGIFNFTNPGVISHNQVLDLYTKIIDPSFKYKNFTLEEQSKILAAGRSNNELDVSKLLAANPDANIPHILDAFEQCFHRMKKNLDAEGWTPSMLKGGK